MTAVDFKALLAKPADTIEKPKALPAGTFQGTITKFDFDVSKEKKTPFVRFTIQVTGAGEDVDQEELTGIDLSKKTLRKDFYITPDAEHRVVTFAESLGHESAGKTLGELIQLCQGGSVIMAVTQRSSSDGADIFNDIGTIAGA